METFRGGVLIAAIIAMGLIAGLLYGYACSVMPGLARADDRTFVTTMQRINVAILNGWFYLSFLGALVLTVLAVVLFLPAEQRSVLPWVVAALVLYGLTIGITGFVNVPLNNQIDAAGDPGKIADLAAVRAGFEARWVRWNIVRTATAVAAVGCLGWALVLHGRLTSAGGS
ncbi:DUF1772 domain-containing protein [Actinomadura craniellae]|uniref:DUF1772 domain-containing protein n=1 Tax=Actinomadura craniellae TaxID=2231787 RepID=A0A365H940_9ACTN|nr:anthrone oxygenase family protein [Actinomadura craniellae]RAY15528.1 DUF1772 domain-containing protein [Actinomadura craniellae]